MTEIPPSTPGPPSPPAWVQTSSTEELCLVWRRSFWILARVQQTGTISAQAAIVGLRQACLDELERRHPAGFARWLGEGALPNADPSRYLSPPAAHLPFPARRTRPS